MTIDVTSPGSFANGTDPSFASPGTDPSFETTLAQAGGSPSPTNADVQQAVEETLLAGPTTSFEETDVRGKAGSIIKNLEEFGSADDGRYIAGIVEAAGNGDRRAINLIDGLLTANDLQGGNIIPQAINQAYYSGAVATGDLAALFNPSTANIPGGMPQLADMLAQTNQIGLISDIGRDVLARTRTTDVSGLSNVPGQDIYEGDAYGAVAVLANTALEGVPGRPATGNSALAADLVSDMGDAAFRDDVAGSIVRARDPAGLEALVSIVNGLDQTSGVTRDATENVFQAILKAGDEGFELRDSQKALDGLTDYVERNIDALALESNPRGGTNETDDAELLPLFVSNVLFNPSNSDATAERGVNALTSAVDRNLIKAEDSIDVGNGISVGEGGNAAGRAAAILASIPAGQERLVAEASERGEDVGEVIGVGAKVISGFAKFGGPKGVVIGALVREGLARVGDAAAERFSRPSAESIAEYDRATQQFGQELATVALPDSTSGVTDERTTPADDPSPDGDPVSDSARNDDIARAQQIEQQFKLFFDTVTERGTTR